MTLQSSHSTLHTFQTLRLRTAQDKPNVLCDNWSSPMRVSTSPTSLGYVRNKILGDTQAFAGAWGTVGIPRGGSGL